MTQARKPRQFSSTEHLASEAVAAYVDGELQMNAYLRAAQHLSLCPECAASVDAQQHVRGALRRASEISMPTSLLGLLSQIPTCTSSGDDGDDPAKTTGRDAQFGRRRASISSMVTSYSFATWRRRR
ncbi:RNA polymerase subunit sigma-70 [Rhodococcus spelaei]|uniref:RNA polymerase subunit sigma-70 n=1 Tax=Rhodococcus spelaei TaxID=2546320 RepID=A0A541AZX9_9NOCA|nr:RNA polymerase subunit sigma-70 [Rhodococcus spelaei]TQF65627.1 RNA polymerase subunit sigma-70 [Rhodococcus spelaei]